MTTGASRDFASRALQLAEEMLADTRLMLDHGREEAVLEAVAKAEAFLAVIRRLLAEEAASS